MKITPNQLTVPQFGARRGGSSGDNVPLFIALGIGALAAGLYYASTRTDVFQRRPANQLARSRDYAGAGGFPPPRQKPATPVEKPQLSNTFMLQLREFFEVQKGALIGALEKVGSTEDAPDKSADEAREGKGPAEDNGEGSSPDPGPGEKV